MTVSIAKDDQRRMLCISLNDYCVNLAFSFSILFAFDNSSCAELLSRHIGSRPFVLAVISASLMTFKPLSKFIILNTFLSNRMID